ncbi:hypothetical protein V5F59_07460 [Xanthobacter autotrophicus DSM 431]|uniref:hypothetical protein n=1 Tax=Xanthobacter nonsaccharivorans TaxID=3119912 RepID=UPI0037280034
MRLWASAAVAFLALTGPVAAQQGAPAGLPLPPEQMRQEFAMIQAAHKAGSPLDPASRFHRLAGEEATRLVAGRRWTFVTLHVEAHFDFFDDGRLRVTNLPSQLFGLPETVRTGTWTVEGDALCLVFETQGGTADRSCMLGYGLGNYVLLGANGDNSPAARNRAMAGTLLSPGAIPD